METAVGTPDPDDRCPTCGHRTATPVSTQTNLVANVVTFDFVNRTVYVPSVTVTGSNIVAPTVTWGGLGS